MKTTQSIQAQERTQVQWPEHFTHGGTGVTRCIVTDANEMRRIVAAFGDPKIFMLGNDLHSTRSPMDLPDFWEFYRTNRA